MVTTPQFFNVQKMDFAWCISKLPEYGERYQKIIPARDPKQCVCVRSVSRKSRDLDTLGSRDDGGDEVKVGVSECG